MSPDPGDTTIPIRIFGPGTAAPNPAPAAAVLILLILAGAFFTVSRIAVLFLNKTRMEKLAEDGDDKAKKLLNLAADTVRLLSAARTGTVAAGMLAASAAVSAFAGPASKIFWFLPFSAAVLRGISSILIALLLSCIWMIFGEMVPKRMALCRPDGTPLRTAGFFLGLTHIFKPMASLLSCISRAVSRVLGAGQPAGGENAAEEEILLMLEAGRRSGMLNKDEKEMISNIFEFDETSAGEAMTHRTDVVAAQDTESVETVVAASMENGCSRIPVYHENLDHVTGIIYVKDLLPYVGSPVPANLRLEQLMRPAYFVPKSKPCGELFGEMRLRRIQIAVVVDEYGGTEGIITMEDLLEAIVGNIQDEYDNEEEEIHRDGENRFDVEGTAPVDEVSEMLGVDLPEGDYDTVAGLMMEHLGRLPRANEHPQVRLGGLTLTVAGMEERRIARIVIEKDAPVPEMQTRRNKEKS
ncbi:MAG: hemolysin family protein [Oscillospiraceae bacterium]|jgi:putative hemolysin|nr:hemolysin family protein [Oscillospiraceae bacterium]